MFFGKQVSRLRNVSNGFSFFKKKKKLYLLIYWPCWVCVAVGFSLVAASGGYSLGVMHRLLIAMASLVTEHGLQGPWASVVVT